MQSFLPSESTATVAILLLAGLLGVLLLTAFFRKKLEKKEALDRLPDQFFIPEESMSVPATLAYVKNGIFSPYITAAAFMELIRKGIIREISEGQYELISRDVDHPHEELLLSLLFERVNYGAPVFQLNDLTYFIEYQTNDLLFLEAHNAWRKEVKREVHLSRVFDTIPMLRSWLIAISLISGTMATACGMGGWVGHSAAAWTISSISMVVAILYKTRSSFGHQQVEAWHAFRNSFDTFGNFNETLWNQFSEQDRFRAYAFAIGAQDQHAEERLDAEWHRLGLSEVVAEKNRIVDHFLQAIQRAEQREMSRHSHRGIVQ
ncbi:DUF2207 family protein [Sporosarcina cyprini]|uniref:DUF2207 family protein n=1 Tax=Sporosarcina cyprini TaxID=2910523 RepID=UPI001EDEE6E1|nr:DUF2207 domain-containing protein [Sporosarcina cyprini]MCG3087995.1 DUF2207 domain-containing protein [Sporosarcina cyprini]